MRSMPIVLSLLWALQLYAVNAVHALTGTVKDPQGKALSGASVYLASDTLSQVQTDASGAFSINKSVGLRNAPGSFAAFSSRQVIDLVTFRGERLGFSLNMASSSVKVTVHGSRGERQAELRVHEPKIGFHDVPLPHLSSGLHFLRIETDRSVFLTHFVQTGESKNLGAMTDLAMDKSSSAARTIEAAPHSARIAITAAVIDTLLVRKTGYSMNRTPVSAYDQTGIAVVLSPTDDAPSALPAITDYTANGPFTTVVETNVGPGGNYTLFRPDPLGKDGFIHSPIIYGHGIGGQVSSFSNFLRNVASHGFVILGCNILNGGPNSAANNTAMTNGLNWLLEQNAVAGSKFQGKLAVKRAASMGYSVGGTAAVDIGGHAALATVVSIHGHISTATLHGTLLQTSGTNDNVGLPMQKQTFANSKVQTFLGVITGADHGYIQQNNGGAQRPAIVAWLRYWLHRDEGAKKYFYGDDCIMCKAPWEAPQRKNWQ